MYWYKVNISTFGHPKFQAVYYKLGVIKCFFFFGLVCLLENKLISIPCGAVFTMEIQFGLTLSKNTLTAREYTLIGLNRGKEGWLLSFRCIKASDQHLISPYNITSESHIKVKRIREMVTN